MKIFKIKKIRFQKGFTLVEVLVAVAILSMLGIALLEALGGASKVLLKDDIRESARDLAQAQMEYVQQQVYDNTDPTGDTVFYPKIADLDTKYPGYDVQILASRIDKDSPSDITDDDGIQEITVIVYQGTEEKFRLVGRKVDW